MVICNIYIYIYICLKISKPIPICNTCIYNHIGEIEWNPCLDTIYLAPETRDKSTSRYNAEWAINHWMVHDLLTSSLVETSATSDADLISSGRLIPVWMAFPKQEKRSCCTLRQIRVAKHRRTLIMMPTAIISETYISLYTLPHPHNKPPPNILLIIPTIW